MQAFHTHCTTGDQKVLQRHSAVRFCVIMHYAFASVSQAPLYLRTYRR